jgi:hypothetical protein
MLTHMQTFTIDMEQCRIKNITADNCCGDVETFPSLEDFRKNWSFDYDY